MYINKRQRQGRLVRGLNSRKRGAGTFRFDILFFLAVVLMASFGVLIIYSATRSSMPGGVGDPAYYLKRQSIFMGAGILLFAGLQFINYRKIRDLWWISAAAGVLSLIAVLVFGYEVNGSKSWIDLGLFPVQPSEFAKIFMIVTVSAFLSKRKTEKVNYISFKKVALASLAAVVFISPGASGA